MKKLDVGAVTKVTIDFGGSAFAVALRKFHSSARSDRIIGAAAAAGGLAGHSSAEQQRQHSCWPGGSCERGADRVGDRGGSWRRFAADGAVSVGLWRYHRRGAIQPTSGVQRRARA